MRKIKKLLAGLIVFLILILACSFILPQKTEAIELNDYLFFWLEASKDNGATWHNYSGTDYSGNETVTANPGDTIKVKLTIWNADDNLITTGISASGSLTNPSYLTVPESGINDDADENLTPIGGVLTAFGAGTATLDTLDDGGLYSSCSDSATNCKSATFSLVLSNTFPVSKTIIFGEITISDFTDRGIQVKNPFIEKVYASSVGHQSAFRISVNVAPSTPIVTTNLPATGSPMPYSDITL